MHFLRRQVVLVLVALFLAGRTGLGKTTAKLEKDYKSGTKQIEEHDAAQKGHYLDKKCSIDASDHTSIFFTPPEGTKWERGNSQHCLKTKWKEISVQPVGFCVPYKNAKGNTGFYEQEKGPIYVRAHPFLVYQQYAEEAGFWYMLFPTAKRKYRPDINYVILQCVVGPILMGLLFIFLQYKLTRQPGVRALADEDEDEPRRML